eukprot:10612677-Heterocapsa_arctica.AAC.1
MRPQSKSCNLEQPGPNAPAAASLSRKSAAELQRKPGRPGTAWSRSPGCPLKSGGIFQRRPLANSGWEELGYPGRPLSAAVSAIPGPVIVPRAAATCATMASGCGHLSGRCGSGNCGGAGLASPSLSLSSWIAGA